MSYEVKYVAVAILGLIANILVSAGLLAVFIKLLIAIFELDAKFFWYFLVVILLSFLDLFLLKRLLSLIWRMPI